MTIDGLLEEHPAGRDWRRFPSLVGTSVRLAWEAGRREVVLAASLQLLNGFAVAGQLLIGRQVLRTLLGHHAALGSIIPGLATIVAVGTVQRFATAADQEQSQLMREMVSQHAESRILAVSSDVDLTHFERPEFFNRLQRANVVSGIRAVEMVQGLFGLARSVSGVSGALVVLILIQPLLLPPLALIILPLWLVGRRNSSATFQFYVGITPLERARQYLVRLFTDRQSVKEIKAFALADYLRGRHGLLGSQRISELRSVTRARLRRSLFASLGSALLTGGTIGILAWQYDSHRLDLASAGMAAAALLQMSATLAMAQSGAAQLYEASLFVEDYLSFLKLGTRLDRSRLIDSAMPNAMQPFRELRADSVTFTYPGSSRPALRDVSVIIKAGQVTALVGENGSGKTTLAKLLAQLYEPTSGHIWWDDTDTTGCDPEELRQFISVIFQDFVQYHLSARENIALGRPGKRGDGDQIRTAARLADADGFLSQLPDGYETMLGKEFAGGVDLSVGQWQRIALARAFFRDAPFVILDEPTAALDARAEFELFERIGELLRGRTVLLISHRFSTVRAADHICVLHRGELVEQGTHDDLMAAEGRYSELFTLQATPYSSFQ